MSDPKPVLCAGCLDDRDCDNVTWLSCRVRMQIWEQGAQYTLRFAVGLAKSQGPVKAYRLLAGTLDNGDGRGLFARNPSVTVNGPGPAVAVDGPLDIVARGHGGPPALRPRGPRFANRCDECNFLGTYDGFDLWLHRSNGAPALRARYSEAPYGFVSCTIASAAEDRLTDYVVRGTPDDIDKQRPMHALRVAYLIATDEDHLL